MPPHYCGWSQILQIRRHLADDQLERFTITLTDSSDNSDMDRDTDTGSLTGTLPAVIDKQYNADDVHQDIQVLVLFSWYSFLLDFYMFCDSICVCSIVLSVCNKVSASILHTDGLEVNLCIIAAGQSSFPYTRCISFSHISFSFTLYMYQPPFLTCHIVPWERTHLFLLPQ